ncbi:MAG TPA: hypothetical protein VN045_02450 [Microbacteriaceae bacterium]|jgi:hypothetical protein|nr:hypothetical protein [Microbacteriaceae bacterium]
MKVTGTIRSTKGWTGHGAGLTAGEAREQAIAEVPAGYELVDTMTESAKPGEPVTMRSSARSVETRAIGADGADYPDALRGLREAVPDGWQLQAVTVESA